MPNPTLVKAGRAAATSTEIALQTGIKYNTLYTMRSSVPDRIPLSKKTLIFFGLTEMPVQVAAVPITAYVLNFYVQDLGLSAALAGMAYLGARIFDVIIDPLIGYLSDRTNTRWGRRRVWIVAGMPITMLGSYMLFFPDPPVTTLYFFI